MPDYDFTCIACDITVTRYFTFHEKHHVECESCGNEMLRVYQPNAAIFKGGGWGGE